MLVVQRIDILGKMLYEEKFDGLTCSLYSNDHVPRRFDTIKYYKMGPSIELLENKWKFQRTQRGWNCNYEEINFIGQDQMFGYIIHKNKILIWSERFDFECVSNPIALRWNLTLLPKIEVG